MLNNILIMERARYEAVSYDGSALKIPHKQAMLLDVIVIREEDGSYTAVKNRFSGAMSWKDEQALQKDLALFEQWSTLIEDVTE